MRICLIGACTVADFGESAGDPLIRATAELPPLGVLTLAAILRSQGMPPAVFDLNRIFFDYLAAGGLRPDSDFCAYAASRIPRDCDVVGFGTICGSYPLTIRIAERLKRASPDTVIVFGGPQASATDVATLEAFPFVDIIVRGEADETLPKLLRLGVRSPALALLPGITFRSRGAAVRNPEAPLIQDLDPLPFPAFDLLAGMDQLPYFPLEMGRGCPFSCTFCSTNDFFRRRFRLKSPEAVLEQMRTARREYGARRFGLVHDMFTVDRKRVAAFCEALIDSGEPFRWGCSARTDCIDGELTELLYRAGCRSVFFGVETGSPRLQRSIEKDLDLADARARIRGCAEMGFDTAVSLITGFPDETIEDMWQTVDLLMETARYESVDPQLHILAPLAGTPLHTRFRGQLLSDNIYSDISYQGWMLEEPDCRLIGAWPEIFPNFYGIPSPALDRPRLKRLRDFVLYGLKRFRAVMVALHQSRGGIRQLFEAWEAAFPALAAGAAERGSYYASLSFRADFARFVRMTFAPNGESDPALEALLRLELGVSEGGAPAGTDGEPLSDEPPKAAWTQIVPVAPAGVRLIDFDVDVCAILASLRRGDGLPVPSSRSVTIATRPGKGYGTDIMELTHFSASFLKRCDGRTLDLVARDIELDEELRGLGRDRVCAIAFEQLRRQRLLAWCPRKPSRRAVQKEAVGKMTRPRSTVSAAGHLSPPPAC